MVVFSYPQYARSSALRQVDNTFIWAAISSGALALASSKDWYVSEHCTTKYMGCFVRSVIVAFLFNKYDLYVGTHSFLLSHINAEAENVNLSPLHLQHMRESSTINRVR